MPPTKRKMNMVKKETENDGPHKKIVGGDINMTYEVQKSPKVPAY